MVPVHGRPDDPSGLPPVVHHRDACSPLCHPAVSRAYTAWVQHLPDRAHAQAPFPIGASVLYIHWEYAIIDNMDQHSQPTPAPALIDTTDALQAMLERLVAESAVAVDTESNSLYAYNERACLIQFAVPGQDYLVDPLAFEDLSSLGRFFAAPGIEKVFHAAEYDVMVLRRDFGFEFANLFDTMIASRIVGWPHYGLGSLLAEHFGIQTDKRMQRTNWGQRPLSAQQIRYAQVDVHYLLPLRDRLVAELKRRGRVEEARTAFNRVAQSEWSSRGFDPHGFWRIRGVEALDETGLAVLRALYLYRDQRARAMDRPPFKVFSDHVLLSLSQARPKSWPELQQIRGLPRYLSSRERKQLLSAIEEGLTSAPPKRPRRERNGGYDQAILDRYEALRKWRNARAASRGVEPDVILSNRTLHLLARHNPTTPAKLETRDLLSEWERQEYGGEIIAVLNGQLQPDLTGEHKT